MRESEAFVALPGGIGTLDEVFTVLAAKTLENTSAAWCSTTLADAGTN